MHLVGRAFRWLPIDADKGGLAWTKLIGRLTDGPSGFEVPKYIPSTRVLAEVGATTAREEMGTRVGTHVGDEVAERSLLVKIQAEVGAFPCANNVSVSPLTKGDVMLEACLEFEFLETMSLPAETDTMMSDSASGTRPAPRLKY